MNGVVVATWRSPARSRMGRECGEASTRQEWVARAEGDAGTVRDGRAVEAAPAPVGVRRAAPQATEPAALDQPQPRGTQDRAVLRLLDQAALHQVGPGAHLLAEPGRDPARARPDQVVQVGDALEVPLVPDRTDAQAGRQLDVDRDGLGVPEDQGLELLGHEARRRQPLPQVGRRVVAVRLPLDPLAAAGKELALAGNDRVGVAPQALGGLDHGPGDRWVGWVAAVHRAGPLDDVVRLGVTVAQTDLLVEGGEHLVRGHPQIRPEGGLLRPALFDGSPAGPAPPRCRRAPGPGRMPCARLRCPRRG